MLTLRPQKTRVLQWRPQHRQALKHANIHHVIRHIPNE